MITIASLLCLLLCALQQRTTHAQLPTGKILWLTDIHLDVNEVPVIGRRFGQFGEDTNVPLWTTAIRTIKTLVDRPDFIIVTGNSVSGNLRNITANGPIIDPLNTLRAVTVALELFAGVPSFLALGPTDVIENMNRKQIYSAVARMWKPWIGDDAVQTLAQFGYYATRIGANTVLMALNTNLFLEEQFDFSDIAAQTHISWLRRMLDRARRAGDSAIIIGHAPPGIDENGRARWAENFQEQFVDLIEEYSEIIRMTLFGSTHSDAFQIVTQSKKWRKERVSGRGDYSEQQNVMLMAPSLAPWKNPNRSPSSPAFRILDYNRATSELIDVHQYFMDLTLSNQLDLGFWTQLYSFQSAYGIRPVNGWSMLDVFHRLSNDDKLMSEYIDRQGAVNTTKSCDSICRRRLLCSIQHMRSLDWMNCVQPLADANNGKYLANEAWVPIVAGALLLLFVISLSVYFGARTAQRWCGYKRFA